MPEVVEPARLTLKEGGGARGGGAEPATGGRRGTGKRRERCRRAGQDCGILAACPPLSPRFAPTSPLDTPLCRGFLGGGDGSGEAGPVGVLAGMSRPGREGGEAPGGGLGWQGPRSLEGRGGGINRPTNIVLGKTMSEVAPDVVQDRHTSYDVTMLRYLVLYKYITYRNCGRDQQTSDRSGPRRRNLFDGLGLGKCCYRLD